MSDFETVKEAVSLKEYAESHLEHVGRGLVCPVCGSGKGKNKTPALSIRGDKWKCFSCQSGGDVFDLAGVLTGSREKREQLEAVARWAGMTIEEPQTFAPRPKAQPIPARDYTKGREKEAAYIAEAQAHVSDPSAVAYIRSRGFTEAEAQAFGLGYDPQRGRIVIPWKGSSYYHIDRTTDASAEGGKYLKPKADDVGAQPLYNPNALQAEAFFVVEGAIDALAVEACGFEAVALGGTATTKALEAMTTRGVEGVAVAMLDNDEKGKAAQAELLAALQAAGISCRACEIPDHKDAGEWLEADRDGLRAFLSRVFGETVVEAEAERERAYTAALSRLRVIDPLDIAAKLYCEGVAVEPVSTGIAPLDDVLGGGLQAGLYVLGAVSSLGKTTLAAQIADYVAASGRGVLFTTIEQSAAEIVAKSLSRYVYQTTGANMSTQEVMGIRRDYWQGGEYDALRIACERYSAEVAPRMRIFEGIRQPTVTDVEAVAQMMREHDGEPPCIFVDYLQLLAPHDEHDTDKRATDRNIMALRQLARDLKTPVFAISSLNRSSYSEGVTMEAFKESGAIEYGSDCLLGLQPQGITEKLDSIGEKGQKRTANKALRQHRDGLERACEIVVLKNRNGRTPEAGIPLTFRPINSIFTL